MSMLARCVWLSQLVIQLYVFQLCVYPAVCHEHQLKLETEDGEALNPLRQKEFAVDRGHAAEHAKKWDKRIDDMSESEVAFQFFMSHDLNEDGHLDGLELYYALEHGMEDALDNIKITEYEARVKARQNLRGSYERSVDRMLTEDDANKDGLLSYTEYSLARTSPNILGTAARN